jgi:hypothetical protein
MERRRREYVTLVVGKSLGAVFGLRNTVYRNILIEPNVTIRDTNWRTLDH